MNTNDPTKLNLGFASLDLERPQRCGIPEVVYAAGKSPEQVVRITRQLRQHHDYVLITRCTDAHRTALEHHFARQEPMRSSELSGTVLVGIAPKSIDPAIPIVTAGTSDLRVAQEAEITCEALGQKTQTISDVGVAGLHRLMEHLPTLRTSRVLIVIAGMEGALPSVIGGLVNVPIIAVPTSVGYGANFQGLSALLGMLTSCAAGITVVNIDNGFGAAVAACRINQPVWMQHDEKQAKK